MAMTLPVAGCFHCGEPLKLSGGASRESLRVRVQGTDVAVCCPGCRAAVQLIGELGLDDFYRFRTVVSPKPADAVCAWSAYDDPALLETFTREGPDGRNVVLMIDGMTCAACSWLVGRSLQHIAGVRHVSVNTATGRAQIVWDSAALKLSEIFGVIASLGYKPQIAAAENDAVRGQNERRSLLKRLAVAGLGMMQVMMFAVAMYAGDMQGMEADVRTYLRIVSQLIATPVMLYGGWPYFAGAARALAKRTITMDVPVALGLMLAYSASVFNTWRHSGEVYFDSVTMFIFFLTVARYVEMVARHQSTQVSDSLGRMLPATAHRLSSGGPGAPVTDVAVSQIVVGDRLLVRTGEVVPADGELTRGGTELDESMLTGESLPVQRGVGDRVTGGTINVGAPVQMRVTAAGRGTVLASIVALLTRAQSERPRITRAGDRFSSRFLARVLIGAVLVCAFWSIVEPGRAFDATLAVLVVACPCAFSLATLVAVASANAALARRGVLVTSPDAIEGLSRVTRVVFDKTGTLTDGVVAISRCIPLGASSAAECLQIAAALEVGSEHPIARAFADPEMSREGLQAHDVQVVAGGGVSGIVNGKHFKIGTRAFASGAPRPPSAPTDEIDDAVVFLSSEEGDLATFAVADEPRPESVHTVAALRGQGLGIEILSGDSALAVRRLARHCGIGNISARRSPAQKLERVRSLASQGEFVAMVGDGINDAPVLGGAGVSIAMSRGSALTLASADLILIGDSLEALPEAFSMARRATRVIRQNLVWAAGYNLIAMPLAAMGWVPPWAAAIGMSMSSMLVVLNSLRLIRCGRPRPALPEAAPPALSFAPLTPAQALRNAAP
jgi:Cu2+-exporting ATPase